LGVLHVSPVSQADPHGRSGGAVLTDGHCALLMQLFVVVTLHPPSARRT
jgi:hypothetical protein